MISAIRRLGDENIDLKPSIEKPSEERVKKLHELFFNLDFVSRQGQITTTEYIERASQTLDQLKNIPQVNKSLFKGDFNKVLSNIENRLVKSFEALGWIKNQSSITPAKLYQLDQDQHSLNEKVANVFFQYNVLFTDKRRPHLKPTPTPPKKEHTWLYYTNPITYLPITGKVCKAVFNFAHRELELSKRTTYATMLALTSYAFYSCNCISTTAFIGIETGTAILLLSQF
jgi:hypothetical protein